MTVPAERNTKQKRAIRDAFQAESRPLSIDEVFAAAQRVIRGLGKATVYRAIRALLDDGWLTAVEVPGRGVLYEVAGKDHHHHFACESCDRVYELEGCESGAKLRLPRGFRATRHEITFHGLCANCSVHAREAT